MINNRSVIIEDLVIIYLSIWAWLLPYVILYCIYLILIVLGFNNTSTLVGHFVLSPREREKWDRKDSWGGDEREEQWRKKKMNESEDTEEIQHSPSTHTCCKDSRPCPTVSQYQWDTLVMQDTWHLATLNHPQYIFGQTGLSKHCRPRWDTANVASHQGLHCLPLIHYF